MMEHGQYVVNSRVVHLAGGGPQIKFCSGPMKPWPGPELTLHLPLTFRHLRSCYGGPWVISPPTSMKQGRTKDRPPCRTAFTDTQTQIVACITRHKLQDASMRRINSRGWSCFIVYSVFWFVSLWDEPSSIMQELLQEQERVWMTLNLQSESEDAASLSEWCCTIPLISPHNCR